MSDTYYAGDLNRDGQITMADIPSLMTALSDLSSYRSTHPDVSDMTHLLDVADVNGDGIINDADLQALISLVANNAASGHGGLTAVPEPATLSLCGMGFSVFAVRRIRRCMAR